MMASAEVHIREDAETSSHSLPSSSLTCWMSRWRWSEPEASRYTGDALLDPGSSGGMEIAWT